MLNILEFPKHIRKRMRKQFKNNPPCPKCRQITPVVYIGDNKYNKPDEYYCSWCNKVFKKIDEAI